MQARRQGCCPEHAISSSSLMCKTLIVQGVDRGRGRSQNLRTLTELEVLDEFLFRTSDATHSSVPWKAWRTLPPPHLVSLKRNLAADVLARGGGADDHDALPREGARLPVVVAVHLAPQEALRPCARAAPSAAEGLEELHIPFLVVWNGPLGR